MVQESLEGTGGKCFILTLGEGYKGSGNETIC